MKIIDYDIRYELVKDVPEVMIVHKHYLKYLITSEYAISELPSNRANHELSPVKISFFALPK